MTTLKFLSEKSPAASMTKFELLVAINAASLAGSGWSDNEIVERAESLARRTLERLSKHGPTFDLVEESEKALQAEGSQKYVRRSRRQRYGKAPRVQGCKEV